MSGFSMIDLEHYLAGTLAPERAAAIERAAERDPKLRAFIEERRQLSSDLDRDPRVKPFAALAPNEPTKRRWWIPTFAVAATTAGVLFAVVPDRDPAVHVRGGVTVRALLSRDGAAPVTVRSGSVVHPGDKIQLRVEDPNGGHLAVLLQEASGDVEALYDRGALQMTPPGLTLPDSLELDSALGRERIYVILCTAEPDSDRWPEEIRARYDSEGQAWLPPVGCRLGLFEYDKR